MLRSRTNWTMFAAFVAVAGLLAAGVVQAQETAQTPPPPPAKKAPAATTAPEPPAAAAQKAPPPPQGQGPCQMGMGPMQRGRGGPLGPMVMRGLRELNLTEEQRGQLKSVMDSHKDEFKAIGKRMMAAREALGDLVTSDAADETAIRDQAAAIAVVEGDAALLRAKVHTEVFALLTPDQREKAKAMRGQAKGRLKQIVSRVLQNL